MPPLQGFLHSLNLSGVRACLAALVRRVLRVDGSGMKSHCATAPVPPEPLKLLWTAVTCHRFQSADMSAHFKGERAGFDATFFDLNLNHAELNFFTLADENRWIIFSA